VINRYNTEYNGAKYEYVRNHGGWEAWNVVPIAVSTYETRTEMLIALRLLVEREKPMLNGLPSVAATSEAVNERRRAVRMLTKLRAERVDQEVAKSAMAGVLESY